LSRDSSWPVRNSQYSSQLLIAMSAGLTLQMA
jgi:hypothetical protein